MKKKKNALIHPVIQVTSDSGELALSEVYKLISEGESLPVHFDTELKVYI